MNSNLLLGLVLIAACFLSDCAAHAHDWFEGKKNNNGGPCCTGNDCIRVKAWVDDKGRWVFTYKDGIDYIVPEDIIHPDNENPEPFQAFACVYNGKPICFWKKRSGT